LLAAGMIDVFILDSQQLDEYSINPFLRPLDDTLAEIKAIDPAVYSRIDEHIVYAMHMIEEDEFEERMMGISIRNSPRIKELGFFDYEMIFGITSNTGNHENVVAALIAFFD